MNYVTLDDETKLKLLQLHSFQAPFPTLAKKNWCLHCEQQFDGYSVRVWEGGAGALWLECGTEGCNGSPIDWAPYPWGKPRNLSFKEYASRVARKKRLSSTSKEAAEG